MYASDDELSDLSSTYSSNDHDCVNRLPPGAPTVWNETWKYFKLGKALHEQLVPWFGKAETDEGETLRIVYNVYYDYNNNGNHSFQSIRDNGRLDPSELDHILEHGPSIIRDLYTSYDDEDRDSMVIYDDEMEQMMQDTIMWAGVDAMLQDRATKIQAAVRGWLSRRHYADMLEQHYRPDGEGGGQGKQSVMRKTLQLCENVKIMCL